jgi:hypothetical protein
VSPEPLGEVAVGAEEFDVMDFSRTVGRKTPVKLMISTLAFHEDFVRIF